MWYVVLAAAFQIINASLILFDRSLQVSFLVCTFNLLIFVFSALSELVKEMFVIWASNFVTNAQLPVQLRIFGVFKLRFLSLHDILVALAVVLMQYLTSLVKVSIELLHHKFVEEAVLWVLMMAAANSIVLFWHGGNEVLGVLECLSHWLLADERLQKSLIEFKGARLRNLIICVNSYHYWRRLDSFGKDSAKTLWVACA